MNLPTNLAKSTHKEEKKMNDNINNINQLISEYYRKNPEGHFFDHDTLKFFGGKRFLYAAFERYNKDYRY